MGVSYLDAMVPEDGESALDVQPVTRNPTDLAANSPSGWRIPPLPEQPHFFGLFGVTDPDGHHPASRPPTQPNGSPAQVWELPTGHNCLITMPAELTGLLLELAS